MAKTKTFIGFHGYCPDGWASAYAAWRKCGYEKQMSKKHKEVFTYQPLFYGEKPPDLSEYDNAILLDFAYPEHELDALSEQVDDLYVIDHHASNKHLVGRRDAHYDLDHSGAILTWGHFYDNVAPPFLLLYVEDRDLGRTWDGTSDLPYSEEINAALSSYKFDSFEEYDSVVRYFQFEMEQDYGYVSPERDELTWSNEGWDSQVQTTSLFNEGEAILRYQKTLVSAICDHAQLKSEFIIIPADEGKEWMPERIWKNVPIVQTAVLHSDVGHELLQRNPEAPFSVTFREKDGLRTYSLRSEDGREDVSKIAKLAGGGGHPNAAGFEVEI